MKFAFEKRGGLFTEITFIFTKIAKKHEIRLHNEMSKFY